VKKISLLLLIISIFLNAYTQTKVTSNDSREAPLFDNDKHDKHEYIKDESKVSFICECKDVTYIKTDKVTGNIKADSRETLIITNDGGKTGFNVTVSRRQETIILSIVATGEENFINDEDKMCVVFNDGTKIKLMNVGKFNYNPMFTIYLGNNYGNKNKLETFKSKEIKTLRVQNSHGYFEKNLTSLQSKILMKTFECLDNI